MHVGGDGMGLLRAVFADGALPRLQVLPQVELLRQVWVQQYSARRIGPAAVAGPEVPQGPSERGATWPRRAALPPGAEGRPDPEKRQCSMGQCGDRPSLRPRGPLLPEAHRGREEALDRLPRSPDRDL
ncbi:hypothetical protein ACRAWF_29295 [Streptomyces sp. L7]